MRLCAYFGVVCGLLISNNSIAHAQSVSNCDTSLAPSIESSSMNYASLQSYLSINASKEYDKLQKASNDEKRASAAYKYFGAEYEASHSSSEFQEKVRDRLSKEKFFMEENLAKAHYRRYLSDSQLTAWSECIQRMSGSGAVMIYPVRSDSGAFPIKIKWIPQTGVGSGLLKIGVRNAKIEGKRKFEERLKGARELPLIVDPDESTNGDSRGSIVLTAEIAGVTDILVLPLKYLESKPPPPPPPPPPPREVINVVASNYLRPLNVALGGNSSEYGADVLLNGPPFNARPNAAEWEFASNGGGVYLLKIEYAAAAPRPCRVLINGQVVTEGAMASPTGCWHPQCQQLRDQVKVDLKNGVNVMRVERGDVFPHIRRFVFEPR